MSMHVELNIHQLRRLSILLSARKAELAVRVGMLSADPLSCVEAQHMQAEMRDLEDIHRLLALAVNTR